MVIKYSSYAESDHLRKLANENLVRFLQECKHEVKILNSGIREEPRLPLRYKDDTNRYAIQDMPIKKFTDIVITTQVEQGRTKGR